MSNSCVILLLFLTVVAGEMTIFRLPGDTIPISYDLFVAPDYDAAVSTDHAVVGYDGEVKIVIYAKSSTSLITLNCKNLIVNVTYVREKLTEKTVNVIDVEYDHQNEQIKIKLEFELYVYVQYILNVKFRGTIEKGTSGFYESTYPAANPDDRPE